MHMELSSSFFFFMMLEISSPGDSHKAHMSAYLS